MADRKVKCFWKTPILTVVLPGDELVKIMAPYIIDPPHPHKSAVTKPSSSNLGTAWSAEDINSLYDMRQEKKPWSHIGKVLGRSGGAAQQQWIRMQREHHPLLQKSDDQGEVTMVDVEDEPQDAAVAGSPLLNGAATPDETSRKCLGCGDTEASNVPDMATCSACHKAYHQHCHDPVISKEFLGATDIAWYCTRCRESNSSIGSLLAENLNTALDGSSTRRGKKRKRKVSTNYPSEEETRKDESQKDETHHEDVVAQKMKALEDQIEGMRQSNATMQQRMDEFLASQIKKDEEKDAEIEKLKKSVEGWKEAALEKQTGSPRKNSWLAKTMRVTGFGGAQSP